MVSGREEGVGRAYDVAKAGEEKGMQMEGQGPGAGGWGSGAWLGRARVIWEQGLTGSSTGGVPC